MRGLDPRIHAIVHIVIASQRVRAKRGPMTGSAKQSRPIALQAQAGLLRRWRASQ
jgi:hypothetical protein